MNAIKHSSDVVIVGGGIGGLASAFSLASAGHRVTVLERAAEFSEVGAGLQMAPNATRILREWGLLDAVLDKGVAPRRLVFKDAADGEELTHLNLGEDFVARYGAPYVVIHRSDLLTILVEACANAGVTLRSATRVQDVVTSDDTATITSDAGEFTADLALAADGIRSALRRGLSDDAPVASGYIAYRGAFPVSELDVELDENALQDIVVYLGAGCHLVQYPLRGGEILNTVAVFESPAYRRGEEDWGTPQELDEAFAHTCEAVRRGLKSLWRSRKWPMYDRAPIPQWVDGRLALTGDAAHPMLQYLAQGACQAIEDAQVLTTEAAKTAAEGALNWDEALASYQAIRTDRTARIQSTARIWGDIWHVGGTARLLRNELLRQRAIDDYKHIDWLYGI
jgi:salicylate hydroxylase